MGEFQFSAPQPPEALSPMAQTAIRVTAIAGRLAVEERTIVRNVGGRLENVAEHSNMLAIVAPVLSEEYFPELNADRIARYALHDLLEAYCGDTPTHIITTDQLQAKAERERTALQQLKVEYAVLPGFVTLVKEYEAQEMPEARFVRMSDKLMPLLVHINDAGYGFRIAGYTPTAIRQSSAERARDFLREYPDMATIVELRVELSDYAAGQLEED